MLKAKKIRIYSFLFGLFLISTVIASIAVFGVQESKTVSDSEVIDDSDITTNELKQRIIWDIEQLINEIANSSDEYWREPVSQRKEEITIKLIEIKDLIVLEIFKEAYQKFLHEIKPKLTGLETDENEIPWGDGVFTYPWIISEELNEEFQVICNDILTNIKLMTFLD